MQIDRTDIDKRIQSCWSLQMERKATTNMMKWGTQDFKTLALAIAEETGELAQAILQYKDEEKPSINILNETYDLAALCFQMIVRYEEGEGRSCK